MLPLLGIGAALGGIGSLIGGINAGKAQKKAANSQADIAKSQQGLFNQTSPYYTQLLQHLSDYSNTGQLPAGYANQNNPQMIQANANVGRNLQRSQDQLSFGLGRRGLTGSSMDVAGRAALLANANNQQSDVQRNFLPQQYEHRLGLLANAINPGLGMGQAASAGFGQQAGMYGQQAAGAGQNLSQILQNYMLNNQLQQMQKSRSANLVLDDFIAQGL